MPKDLAERVGEFAEQNERSVDHVVRQALREHLDRHGQRDRSRLQKAREMSGLELEDVAARVGVLPDRVELWEVSARPAPPARAAVGSVRGVVSGVFHRAAFQSRCRCAAPLSLVVDQRHDDVAGVHHVVDLEFEICPAL